MQFSSYEEAYAALGIEQGIAADFFDVKRAWRYLVKYHHPDVFQNQTMREEATERLKRYNAAFEHLERYWETHNSMPPRSADFTVHGQSSERHQSSGTMNNQGQTNNGARAEAGGGAQSKQSSADGSNRNTSGSNRNASGGAGASTEQKSDRDDFWNAYNKKTTGASTKTAEEEFWENMDRAYPPPRDQQQFSFGPPPPAKTKLHELFDQMDRWEHDANTMWRVVAIYVGTFIAVGTLTIGAWRGLMNLFGINLAQAANNPWSGMLILVSSYMAYYFFYFGWYYSYKTYRLLQHPFIDMSYPASANEVLQAIREGLVHCVFRHGTWKIAPMEVDDRGVWTLTGTIQSDDTTDGDSKLLKVIVKVWEQNSNVSSVAFWFEDQTGSWFKRIAAKAFTLTNDRLRESLGVPHPNYRKPIAH